jgi:hypothetical protein
VLKGATELRSNLMGQVFGRLIVIGYSGRRKSGVNLWLCHCECGNMVIVVGSHVTCGNTKSCGCLRNENIVKVSKTHGLSGHFLYHTWCQLNDRCNNSKSDSYPDYGERGIYVCQEWHENNPNGTRNFVEWGEQQTHAGETGYTLERRDNDGPYSPENCTFVDKKTQQSNRRPSITNAKYNALLKDFNQLKLELENLKSLVSQEFLANCGR